MKTRSSDMHVELMRENEKELSVWCDPSSIRSARIWHCKFKSLFPIRDWTKIETLVIATYPDNNFDLLSHLTSLRYLRILHLPKVTSLTPLANLCSLESLSLETSPGWDASGKVTVVDSLEPLSALPKLNHLQLFGVRAASKSLSGLEGCTNLLSGRFSKIPRKEVLRFQVAMGITDGRMPEPTFSNS